MASAAAVGQDRSASIGRVFSRAFGTILSNPSATLGIAFLFGTLPSLLLAYAVEAQTNSPFISLGPFAAFGVSLFSAVATIGLAMITQGALVRATTAFSDGRKSGFGHCAMAGLRSALPLFLLGLVSAIGIVLGFLLLIVPGVMLYVVWSVAASALVEERLGPIEAFKRSRRLTKGARGMIFTLTLIILAAYLMFSALIETLSVMWYGDVLVIAARDIPEMHLRNLLVDSFSGTLIFVIWGVVQTSLYVELRDRKDGPRAEQLADIFG